MVKSPTILKPPLCLLDTPKSIIFNSLVDSLRTRFYGLMSRCIKPALCTTSIAETSWRKTSSNSCSLKNLLLADSGPPFCPYLRFCSFKISFRLRPRQYSVMRKTFKPFSNTSQSCMTFGWLILERTSAYRLQHSSLYQRSAAVLFSAFIATARLRLPHQPFITFEKEPYPSTSS